MIVGLEESCTSDDLDRPDSIYLEDELADVWGRPVDRIYITPNELRGHALLERRYASLETLLCSRIIFERDEDDNVVK